MAHSVCQDLSAVSLAFSCSHEMKEWIRAECMVTYLASVSAWSLPARS